MKQDFFTSLIENVKLFKDKYKIEVPLYKIPKALRDLRLHYSTSYPFSDEKIIWLKTPKCAGSSVQESLEDAGYLYMMKPGKRVITGVYSGQVEQFKRLYPEFWKEAWKFSIVRNPYDKFVSGWKYLRATQDLPLIEVLRNPPEKTPRYGDWTHLTRAQSDAFYDESGKFIIDKILYFENINNELNVVLDKFLLPAVELPFVNTARHRTSGYIKYFDEEARMLLEDRYKKDLELFGYEFEDKS